MLSEKIRTEPEEGGGEWGHTLGRAFSIPRTSFISCHRTSNFRTKSGFSTFSILAILRPLVFTPELMKFNTFSNVSRWRSEGKWRSKRRKSNRPRRKEGSDGCAWLTFALDCLYLLRRYLRKFVTKISCSWHPRDCNSWRDKLWCDLPKITVSSLSNRGFIFAFHFLLGKSGNSPEVG